MLCQTWHMTERDYNQCVELHADKLYRFILKNIRNSEDARDIVQSSFEKLWLKRSNVDSATSKSYLYTVAYHEMIDQIRKRRKVSEIEEQPLYQRSAGQKKLVEMALSRLTDLQRSLVLLKDMEGYSYEEISEVTGLNVVQVKVYLHRARLIIRNYIGSLEKAMDFA
jgi:RNA polymerase sigma factor (sigma-70 family)